jgi:Arc/MetJ-type ribon-helix-helix transcriptional regulator
MKKVTVRLPEHYIDSIDILVRNNTYPNQSELIRDAVRHLIDQKTPQLHTPIPRRG